MALTHIEKLIAKAILDYELLKPGDRILLGASGGKDSTTLAWALGRRKKWNAPAFEIEALRIASDVPGGGMPMAAAQRLAALYEEWGISLHTMEVPIVERLKPGQKMSCYWCSTQRRTELLRYAMDHGFNKIALGHHLDDVLATLLMNMTKKGELATMPPRLKYDKYPVEIIRPLVLVSEEAIRGFAREMGWLQITCSCGYGDDGERKEYQRRLDTLTAGSVDAKLLMLKSLSNIKKDYLA
ncbi:tRNA 2-thiocytidine biosynthesis TtcA family protein [Gracilinema caldarium]|uniref:tRNA 2-thiocytidine biosynthesis TtcA family protein n=1 Tax=Gracilinema caldarium TaxID=215591 RepID=UPI0026EFE1F3|nr:tRNA 2-thiocytidine biosynthesis TtcA family protein [Gracilinema caldarium]